MSRRYDRYASVKLIPFALIVLLIVAAFQNGSAQSFIHIDIQVGKIFADSVYNAALSKKELFLRSKIWVVDYFKSPKAVIDLEDSGSGIIIGKGISDIEFPVAGSRFKTHCHYSFKISTKENKFRIEVYDIIYRSDPKYIGGNYIESKETLPSFWFIPNYRAGFEATSESYKNETYRVINELFSSASSALLKPLSQNDNW